MPLSSVLNEKLGKILLVMIPFTAFGPEIPRNAMKSNRVFDAVLRGNQSRPVERIGDAQPLERAVQRIAQRSRESHARLRVVLQVLQLRRWADSDSVR